MSTLRDRLRNTVIRYVSVYLIFGLLLSSAGLWLFSEIAEDVLAGAPIVAIDTALADALHLQATPLSTSVYLFVTWFGGPGIAVVGVIAGLLFLQRRRWPYMTIWAIALVGGGLLNAQTKLYFARPRPVFLNPLAIEQSFSFPSGHAMTSLIAYGLLAYILWNEIRNRYVRIFAVFAAALLIVLVGISRMALGVHYLSDVIGGFAAGGIWLGMCIAALSVWTRREALLRETADVPDAQDG